MKASRNKNPLVVCNHCDGEGMVPLSDELMETLKVTRTMKRITAPLLADKIKFDGHVTAMNNRLNDLVDYGFFTRERDGRSFVYSRIPKHVPRATS